VSDVRVLSDEARNFRRLIIDTFWTDRALYVSADRFVGECVICGDPIGVEFHGFAARATLNCHGGCTESELAERLGLVVRDVR
jgi:hypothetical protein